MSNTQCLQRLHDHPALVIINNRHPSTPTLKFQCVVADVIPTVQSIREIDQATE